MFPLPFFEFCGPPQALRASSPKGTPLPLYRKLYRYRQKPSPWTDSPRPGRDVAPATEWGAGGKAAGFDGRGNAPQASAPHKEDT